MWSQIMNSRHVLHKSPMDAVTIAMSLIFVGQLCQPTSTAQQHSLHDYNSCTIHHIIIIFVMTKCTHDQVAS